jgi:RNA polymerase sigma-70 factor (ECF subfamily)
MNETGLCNELLGVAPDARFVMGGGSRHGHPDERLDDTAAMARAYDAHAGELYGFALRTLDDRSTAEEAVQETFVRAWRAASRFDPSIGGVRTWLFAICRNVVVDLSRSRVARANRDQMLVSNPNHDDLERRLRAWQVEEALGRLSDHHRQVVVATFYEGLSAKEVAAALSIPEGTVRSRLFYGLKALRLTLDEMGWEGD